MKTKNIIMFALNSDMASIQELEYVKQVICPDVEQVRGNYRGESELSYAVPVVLAVGFIDSKALHIILHLTNQESILHVNEQGESYLLFQCDGYRYGDNSKYLGHLKEVTKEQARHLENFTYDYNNNKYYACF